MISVVCRMYSSDCTFVGRVKHGKAEITAFSAEAKRRLLEAMCPIAAPPTKPAAPAIAILRRLSSDSLVVPFLKLH